MTAGGRGKWEQRVPETVSTYPRVVGYFEIQPFRIPSESKRRAYSRGLSEIDFGSPQIKSQDFGEEGGVDY